MSRATVFALALAVAAATACRSRQASQTGVPEDEVWLSPGTLERGTAHVVEAREQELPRAITAAGRVAFDDQRVAHVFSPVAGRVTRILAGLGQRVEKGAPLLALLSPEAGTAFADLAKARADLALASADLARQRRLIARDAAPRRDLEAAEDAHRKATAELARAQQRAALLRSSSVDEVTQELVLRSPIAGEVMARAVSPGMEIQGTSTGTPLDLITVGDIARVWVLADVAESELASVRRGATATVRVAAWPGRAFRGTVDLVAAALDPITRTGRIRLSLDNADRALRPEMLAQVAVDLPPSRGLALPDGAVVHVEGETFAFVAAGESADARLRFVRRRVRTDGASPLATVASGLAAGDRVLVEETGAHEGGGVEARISEHQRQEAHIEVITAAEEEVKDAIVVGGRAAFDDSRMARVFSPVTGRVARVLARPGEHVRKGAPLLTITSPEVGSAFADALKARADEVAARHERDRQRELVSAHAGAPRELEAADAAYARAGAELARAQQKVRLLQAGSFDAVKQEYTLRSPVDGEVVSRAAAPGLEIQGQWSGAGAPVELFTVGALDPLWIVGDVFEMDLPHVRRGDRVEVRAPALPGRTFRGKVDWISPSLDPAQRTARIRCVVENPEHLLRPDMSPVMSVALAPRRHLAVPRTAVLRLGDDTVVFVAAGKAPDGQLLFKRRRVIVGEEGPSGLVPILDGLVPGESVVHRGAIWLAGLL